MIDYQLQMAALREFSDTLAAEAIADPSVADQRDRDIAAVQQDPALAALGALLPHVVWHASADGIELELLEDAAALWAEGLSLYDTLGRFRSGLERTLADPANAAGVAAFNEVVEELRMLILKVVDQDKRVEALRKRVVTFDHLPPHPRQQDRQLGDWGWSDILLARRTDAFVRELVRRARADDARAFGVGALSAYGANAAGSMYLGQVVGGPRRAHRFRDRLARNAVGSWIGSEWPGVPTPGETAELVAQADLPPALESALHAVYPTASLPPLPDLQLGRSRMVRHLQLLDGFRVPAMPEPPAEPFLTRLYGDPARPYVPTMPEQTGLTEAGQSAGPGGIMPLGFGTDDGPDHSEPPPSTEAKCGAFWKMLWSSIVFSMLWFACISRWEDHERCQLWDDVEENWNKAFSGGIQVAGEMSAGAQALTPDQAAAIAQREELTQLVGDLHNTQTMMWEGFQKAAEFLALYGLIYPTPFLDRWRYAQYLSTAAAEWPLLRDDGPRFDEYPKTALELPLGAVGYPQGSAPSVILSGQRSAGSISLPLWLQITEDEFDAGNLDLDADRGWRHPCWAAEGLISDQPLEVRVLGYEEV